MHVILIAAGVGLFLTGLVCAAVLPKGWQRLSAFAIVGLISVICMDSAIVLFQKEVHVWHYGKNIRPTNQILEMLADDLRSDDYSQARRHLDFIQAEWKKIAGRTNSFSADDILRELENQSEQDGAGQPATRPESK